MREPLESTPRSACAAFHHTQQNPINALKPPRSSSRSRALRKLLSCSSMTPTLAHVRLLALSRSGSPLLRQCQECKSASSARCRTSLSFRYRLKGCSFPSTMSSTLRFGTGRRSRRQIRCSRKRLGEVHTYNIYIYGLIDIYMSAAISKTGDALLSANRETQCTRKCKAPYCAATAQRAKDGA